MKPQRLLPLLLALIGTLVVASGCVNTARGAKQDIKNADEKVERATK